MTVDLSVPKLLCVCQPLLQSPSCALKVWSISSQAKVFIWFRWSVKSPLHFEQRRVTVSFSACLAQLNLILVYPLQCWVLQWEAIYFIPGNSPKTHSFGYAVLFPCFPPVLQSGCHIPGVFSLDCQSVQRWCSSKVSHCKLSHVLLNVQKISLELVKLFVVEFFFPSRKLYFISMKTVQM